MQAKLTLRTLEAWTLSADFAGIDDFADLCE